MQTEKNLIWRIFSVIPFPFPCIESSMPIEPHPLTARFPHATAAFQVYFNPRCLDHDIGMPHPERPARLHAVLEGCQNLPLETPVGFSIPPPATRDAITRVHHLSYLQALEEACLKGEEYFMSADNPLAQDSFPAILASAGLGVALGQHLATGGAGFALTRPPGHHAGRDRAEGFCFLNQLALAVEEIRAHHPTARFLVVDIDIHHGNGIHYLYNHDPTVFFFSIHGSPAHLYPGTGFDSEQGIDDGEGYTRNITVEPGISGQAWLDQFHRGLQESLRHFTPDFLLVSAGFDAHEEDPYSFANVQDKHFLQVMRTLQNTANTHCQGRLGLTLEGGYSCPVLKRLLPACIEPLARGCPTAGTAKEG